LNSADGENAGDVPRAPNAFGSVPPFCVVMHWPIGVGLPTEVALVPTEAGTLLSRQGAFVCF